MLRMTFTEFCDTFSNIKYLGWRTGFYDDYVYYFQVDDPRNNCRKLVYTFKYTTSQYNPLYDDYEPYDGDKGEVERLRFKIPETEINLDLLTNILHSDKYFVTICDDKGNKLQIKDFRDGDTIYIDGDPFIYNNDKLKYKTVGLYSNYFKPRAISNDILNSLK